MIAQQIFRTATQLGVHFYVDGENLVVTPRDRITDQLRSNIRQHKPDLIRALTDRPMMQRVDIVELMNRACEGLTLKPQQLWRFLSPGDIDDIRDGLIDARTIRGYVQRWDDHPHIVPVGNNLPYPSSRTKNFEKEL